MISLSNLADIAYFPAGLNISIDQLTSHVVSILRQTEPPQEQRKRWKKCRYCANFRFTKTVWGFGSLLALHSLNLISKIRH